MRITMILGVMLECDLTAQLIVFCALHEKYCFVIVFPSNVDGSLYGEYILTLLVFLKRSKLVNVALVHENIDKFTLISENTAVPKFFTLLGMINSDKT